MTPVMIMMMMMMMKSVAVIVLLGLLSVGLPAPLSDCEDLIKPIQIGNEGMLGRWLYVGGSSDLPGSRSLGHLLTSAWLDVTSTPESNVLNLIQTQRVYGQCSSLTYNLTFEDSVLIIEQPFFLKDVFLRSDCLDCVVVHEEIKTNQTTVTSLLLFSKRRKVSSPNLEMFKRQAECLKMPPPMMINTDYEICPDPTSPTPGLDGLKSLLEALQVGQRVARLLDALFDTFVN